MIAERVAELLGGLAVVGVLSAIAGLVWVGRRMGRIHAAWRDPEWRERRRAARASAEIGVLAEDRDTFGGLSIIIDETTPDDMIRLAKRPTRRGE